MAVKAIKASHYKDHAVAGGPSFLSRISIHLAEDQAGPAMMMLIVGPTRHERQ